MSDGDLIQLYSKRILALAADIPLTAPVEAPMGAAKKRSPLCGSTVSVALNLTGGRISEFSQDVKACALGQAAASVLGAVVIGRRRGEIETVRNQLRAILTEGAPAPAAPFEGYEILMPARDFRNRHASILLALDATLDAVTEAEQKACA